MTRSLTRLDVFVALLCFVAALWTVSASAQSCESCKPGDNGKGWHVKTGETTSWCFVSGTFTGNEQTGMANGFKYWDDFFQSNPDPEAGPAPDFDGPTSPPCDIQIFATCTAEFENAEASAAGIGTTSPSGQKTIFIRCTHLESHPSQPPPRSPHYWAWAVAHELGHIMDFAHVAGNCGGQSVMIPELPGSPDPLPGTAKCSDAIKGTEKYWSGSSVQGGGSSGSPEVIEGYLCQVITVEEDWYFWNGTQYEYRFTSSYSYVDWSSCEPI